MFLSSLLFNLFQDFGQDDTPMYRINSKLLGSIESIFHRNKRQVNPYYSIPRESTLDQSSLRDLVQEFSSQHRKLIFRNSFISN